MMKPQTCNVLSSARKKREHRHFFYSDRTIFFSSNSQVLREKNYCLLLGSNLSVYQGQTRFVLAIPAFHVVSHSAPHRTVIQVQNLLGDPPSPAGVFSPSHDLAREQVWTKHPWFGNAPSPKCSRALHSTNLCPARQ